MATNGLPDRDGNQPLIVYGHDAEVIEWMRSHPSFVDAGMCRAVGIAKEGRLIAGVTFFNYRWPDIEVGIVSTSPSWATRKTLGELCAYPFTQLNCSRITALVDASDLRIRRFLTRFGFEHEGTKRQALPDGDAALYGLLKQHCRWLRGNA